MGKIKLKEEKIPEWKGPGRTIKNVSLALPFYKSRIGTYTHRVRSMQQFWNEGNYTHAVVNFWCGNSGFLGRKGFLLKDVVEGEVVCATCEGRAIGAGMDSSRLINGREVRYSPRKIRIEVDYE